MSGRLLLIVTLLLLGIPARAQQIWRPLVVATCGSPPAGYSSISQFPLTMDTAGNLCSEATCGVSPPVTYSPGQTYRILIDTNGMICTAQ